jgi:hypothetical protein
MNDYKILAENLRDIAVEIQVTYLKKYGPDSFLSKEVPEDFVQKVIANLEEVEIIKGIYDVYDAGMEGRDYDNIAYVNADSKQHARLLVAIERNSTEIFFTGFYNAEYVKREVIEKKLYDLKKEQILLEKVL